MKAWQWIALGAACGLAAHAAALYVHHPPGYSSPATIRLWGGDFASKREHLRQVEQIVLTRSTLEELVRVYGLSPSGASLDGAIERLQRAILVGELAEQSFGGGVFQLRVLADQPHTAQQLSRDLMTRFLEQSRTLPTAPSAPVRMVLWGRPAKPVRPVRWMAAERILGLGAMYGALTGVVCFAAQVMWRRTRE